MFKLLLIITVYLSHQGYVRSFRGISTTNHMFERAFAINWPSSFLKILKLLGWNEGNSKNFKKSWLIPKTARNKQAVTGWSNQTNKDFTLKLTSFNSGNYKWAKGQLEKNKQLRNNTVNGAMSITINRVIQIIANDNEVTTLYVLLFFNNDSRHHSSRKFDVNVRCYTN